MYFEGFHFGVRRLERCHLRDFRISHIVCASSFLKKKQGMQTVNRQRYLKYFSENFQEIEWRDDCIERLAQSSAGCSIMDETKMGMRTPRIVARPFVWLRLTELVHVAPP